MYTTDPDELDVSLSEAFEFDSHLDKMAAARRVKNETIAVNEHFGIYQGKKFAPMQRRDGRWCYFIATVSFFDNYTGKTFGRNEYVEFDTFEEALGFIVGFTEFLQWFGETLAASQISIDPTMIHADSLTEEQREAMRAMSKSKLIELYNRESKRLSPSKAMYHQVAYSHTKVYIIAMFALLPKRYRMMAEEEQRKVNEDLGSRGSLNGPSQGFNLLKK